MSARTSNRNRPPHRPISAIIAGDRHRRELGDLAGLAESIAREGLLHPVVIHPDGRLIAGERRLEAIKRLSWTRVPVTVVDLDDIVRGELAENVHRKDFLPSEIDAIRRAMEPMEKAAAKERMREGGKGGENFATLLGKTSDKIGAFAGVSGAPSRKSATSSRLPKPSPRNTASCLPTWTAPGRVDGLHRRLKIIRQAEAIAKEPPPPPNRGPYRVIVADPPWPCEKRDEDPSRRGVLPYTSMSIAQMCAMPIPSIAHADSVLWLWTTNYHMREAFTVLDAWGFEHKTILTWVKDKMGMGDWLRGQTEHCLMAVRGKPVVHLTNQTTVLYAGARALTEARRVLRAGRETLPERRAMRTCFPAAGASGGTATATRCPMTLPTTSRSRSTPHTRQ